MQDDPIENGSPSAKPGNRMYRVPRIRPLKIILPQIHPRRPIGVSLFSLVYGFAGIILVGALLLMLPFSSRTGEWTSFINCLFTATSATCVTGLVVVDTLTHWTAFGQAVIVILIQVGGFGFMTSATLLLVAAGRKIGLRGRIMIRESIGQYQIGGVVRLTRNMLYFTIAVEVIGALIFYYRFSDQFGWQPGIWKSIFTSVSAFNNAGFDLFGGFNSMTGYHVDYVVLLTTAILIFLGGISFVAVQNVFNSRGLHRATVDTKLVLLITGILLALGTLVVLGAEFNNSQTLGGLSLPHKILNAFFQSVTARTAGFNSINTGSLFLVTLLFIMILMFIGGASGSTAGGIKVNTAGILLATVWNTIRGREHPGAFQREFPLQQIFRGMTLLIIAAAWVAFVFLILSATEKFPSVNVLFETISAFGTVGLTTGITPDLSILGKVFIIITMFIGRLGPLTLIFTLSQSQKLTVYRYPKDSVRIG